MKAKRKRVKCKPLGKSKPGVVVYVAKPAEKVSGWIAREEKRAAQHLAAIASER